MKTKHNPNITKLSEAIKLGAKIAKENGIEQTKGIVFERDTEGKVCKACALGMAVIGKQGIEGELFGSSGSPKYHEFWQSLNGSERSTCLIEKVEPVTELFPEDKQMGVEAVFAVHELNDKGDKTPEEIAEILEACGL